MSFLDSINTIDGVPINPDGSPKTAAYEEVDHPQHYGRIAGIECIDVIENFPHNVGAAMKYLWRAGLKPGTDTVTDLRKSLWYVRREVGRLERMRHAADRERLIAERDRMEREGP